MKRAEELLQRDSWVLAAIEQFAPFAATSDQIRVVAAQQGKTMAIGEIRDSLVRLAKRGIVERDVMDDKGVRGWRKAHA